MKSYSAVALFWFVLSLCAISHAGSATCSDIFRSKPTIQEVTSAFDKAKEVRRCYKPGHCHRNVIRLFEEMQNYVPALHPNDVKIILITRATLFDRMESYYRNGDTSGDFGPSTFRAPGARDEEAEWGYHVALEYEGHILDLDRGNTQQVSRKQDYLNGFFLESDFGPGQRSDGQPIDNHLVAWIISGEKYIVHATDQTKSVYSDIESGNIEEIVWQNGIRPVPLKQYMEDSGTSRNTNEPTTKQR